MSSLQTVNPQTLKTLGKEIASRSLSLIKTIEQVIDSLCLQQKMFQALSSVAHEASIQIGAAAGEKPIDPKRSIEKIFLGAQQATKDLHELLIRKRESAEGDPRLTKDDGVVEEFTRTIAIVAELHNNLNTLRWAIAEHDADRSKVVGRFNTAKELTKFLNTKHA